jgi:hypothetical protein
MIKPYKQLSLEERRKIETWRATKVSLDVRLCGNSFDCGAKDRFLRSPSF